MKNHISFLRRVISPLRASALCSYSTTVASGTAEPGLTGGQLNTNTPVRSRGLRKWCFEVILELDDIWMSHCWEGVLISPPTHCFTVITLFFYCLKFEAIFSCAEVLI